MKTIITIQHTQSVHHVNGMVGSLTDWELTEKGKAQAKTIGKNLALLLEGERPVLYSSDLLRAKQTAERIGEALGILPIFRTELRERDLGSAVGKSVKWMKEHQEVYERTIDDRLFSDAESRREEWNRLKPFFDEIMESDGETILIVSHGDLLSVFNSMFMGLSVESMNHFESFGLSGGVSVFLVDDDGKRMIRRLGDLSFMK